jgi:hypothetical protein
MLRSVLGGQVEKNLRRGCPRQTETLAIAGSFTRKVGGFENRLLGPSSFPCIVAEKPVFGNLPKTQVDLNRSMSALP